MIAELSAVVCVALIASTLTFFSGFGLGTLLLPAFAVFMPIELAVAATAVVHLANGLLKAALMGRHADRVVLIRFGGVAVLAAAGGAVLQDVLAAVPPVAEWTAFGRVFQVTAIKLAVAAVMAGFAALEIHPAFERLAFARRWLPLGGLISGFFGGLSGHQGALRSAFLARCDLTKEAFIGTGAMIAVVIDVARLGVYLPERIGTMRELGSSGERIGWLVIAGVVAAFAGTFVGQRLVKKVTLGGVRLTVAVMLMVVSTLLAAGVL